MHEFELIQQYLAPLARDFPGSLGLLDDAAIVRPPEGHEFVITKDAISEGIHYIGNEDPSLIARKLLRTNLSDLAAKGAEPYCYFLALMLPKATPENFVKRFTEGLGEDQREFDIYLAGGDTTATNGALCLSLTALGIVPYGAMLRRNSAKPGDIIVVSGTLSDSALGLKLLTVPSLARMPGGERHWENASDNAPLPTSPLMGEEFLINRYLLPQPRLALGLSLRGVAHACMDISDGLLQDLGHICKASGVAADIHVERLPLSEAAKRMVAHDPQLAELALCGGDDYELLFTLPQGTAIPEGCTTIGVITEGSGVRVFDHGKAVTPVKAGYSHFS